MRKDEYFDETTLILKLIKLKEMQVLFNFYNICEHYSDDKEYGTFSNESEFTDYMLKLIKEYEEGIGEQLTVIAYGDNFSVSCFYWDDNYDVCEDDAKINYLILKNENDKESLMINIFKELYKCILANRLGFYTIVFDFNSIPYEVTIRNIESEKED